ncbi:putative ribonuclease H-like domain-containing protein [Tanacetum coccineum]
MYSFDLKNVVPSGGLTCLFSKATLYESNLWHRRLGHINFKTMNKLMRGNLVRGLPSMLFKNDHTCFACQKGKQHKASYKTKLASSIGQPLQMLHMDLFGPTSIRSINHKIYCLVVTDDYSRFSWVFSLATKDGTSGILKTFITGIENEINHKVKIIRCDNRTEFKNNDMNQFCGMKGIKREFSVSKTLQQNGVTERKNRTLIEAAKTMLADSLLPTTFWAEAVSTAFYVQNRVLMTKPHNKTSYELLHGRPPSISFMRPFGCPMTILNTLDPLGKFDGKVDEGFFVGYSISSKAFRVFNTRTRKVEENLHINFLENKPSVVGSGPDWLFDIDLLTNSMNYEPITAGNQTNKSAGIEDNVDAVPTQQYILLPLLYDSPQSSEDAVTDDAGKKTNEEPANEEIERLTGQREATNTDSTNRVNTVSSSVNVVSSSFTTVDPRRERAQRNEFESMFGEDKDTNGNNTYRIFTPVNAAGSSYENLGGSIPFNAATSTLIETNKALLKDEEAEDVDVYLYRSMIRLLMYLIASRPNIMFAVCACARIQVTPKVSHLHAVKRIFRYLKDSDYAGSSLDKKSTTGGCKFLGKRDLVLLRRKLVMLENFSTAVLNSSGVVKLKITLAEPFNDVYLTLAHTKKVFTNMKRKGKDFSGRVTPLFASMLAPLVVDGEGSGQPSEPQPTPSTTQPRIEEQILDVFRSGMTELVRATTIAVSLDAAHASGDRPRCQEAIGGVIAQTRYKEMVDLVPTPKNPIKTQIQRDAKIAQQLFEEEQAQFEKEQRIAREKAAEQVDSSGWDYEDSIGLFYASSGLVEFIVLTLFLSKGVLAVLTPGFCDASWQCDKDDTKSQTGYVFVVNGGAVDWKSKKQTTIAMSAAQAEYMAASEAAME